ncbi:CD36 family [Popillia japonica]|uniref:CD36 family n=1 Tax=Popillia japonica TaxID=7064 RepID=A0AAW1N654_POPJA
MVHNQYLNVGNNARNRLFGVDPYGRATSFRSKLLMMISQPGKSTRSRIAVILFGLFSLIAGIVFSTIPWVDYMILEHLKLWNGSLSFHYWQKPGVTRLTKVYIFNVTNPDGFLNLGEKPKLLEVGPFVYKEDMEKINIKIHDNGTISFQHKKILHFVPELSKDKNMKLIVPNIPLLLIVPNIPLLSLGSHSNSWGVLQGAASFILRFGNHKPFIPLTPEELVYGYDDPLVNLAHHFYPERKKPPSKMAILLKRNHTENGEVSTIYSGVKDMENFGLLDNVNGARKLPHWDKSPCNDLKASEGSFFPPSYYTKKRQEIYHLYDKDVCRLIPLQYRKSETRKGRRSTTSTIKMNSGGIPVDVYTPADYMYQSVEKAPQNKCFCPGNEYCPPDGVQSIRPCHHDAPLYSSFPHFYNADPSLLEQIDGLNPQKELHESYLKIQPKTGIPLEALVRLQVNLKVSKSPKIRIMSKLPNMILPIMWIEEGVTDLTPALKRYIYLATTFADIAYPIGTYGGILLGTCILIGVFINAYKSIMFTRETIEVSMRTLRRGSHLLHSNNFTRETIEVSMRTLRRGSHLLHSNNHRLLIIRDSYSVLPELPSPSEEFV